MHPRKQILPPQSYAHVFFRCHNQHHLFKREDVKLFLISLWAKYKNRYQIKVFEFAILDNHAHMIVKTPNAEQLGHFMRTVNSQIARYINHVHKRDSAALRERYKSPLISTFEYMKHTMKYIWMNRQKAMGRSAVSDPFCSLSWRLVPEMARKLASGDKETDLFQKLLDHDDQIYPSEPKAKRRFISDLFNSAYSSLKGVNEKMFTHGHTIGDKISVEFRSGLLASFRREAIPWDDPVIVHPISVMG